MFLFYVPFSSDQLTISKFFQKALDTALQGEKSNSQHGEVEKSISIFWFKFFPQLC